jgi:hypothetical protein
LGFIAIGEAREKSGKRRKVRVAVGENFILGGELLGRLYRRIRVGFMLKVKNAQDTSSNPQVDRTINKKPVGVPAFII